MDCNGFFVTSVTKNVTSDTSGGVGGFRIFAGNEFFLNSSCFMINTFKKLLKIPLKVHIEWEDPKDFAICLQESNEEMYNWGLYQITRTYRSKEQLLYVGKTFTDFRARLTDHGHPEKGWIKNYKGTISVRFGRIIKPSISDANLLEIESAIILETQPPVNDISKKSYTIKQAYEYEIYSTGNGGFIPSRIYTKDHTP